MRKEWTKEEVEILEQGYRDGKSLSEISNILNRDYRSVQSKANKMKLGQKYNTIKRWNKEDDQLLIKLYCANKTSEEMAVELNTTASSVNARLNKLNIPATHQKQYYEDLTGKTFYMLTAKRRINDKIEPNGRKRAMWEWECNCSEHNVIVASPDSVKYGGIKSCGCLQHRKGIDSPSKKYNEYYECNNIVFVKYSDCNEYFICDKEDWDRLKVYCWGNTHGYAVTRIGSKNFPFHRMIIENIPDDLYIDHWYQVGLGVCDNRKKNLRITDHQTNMMNQRIRSNNTSGIIGVCQNPNGSWYAQIKINYKDKYLGSSPNKVEAIKLRLQAEHDYYREFAPQWQLFKKYGIDDSDLNYWGVTLANPDNQKRYGYVPLTKVMEEGAA